MGAPARGSIRPPAWWPARPVTCGHEGRARGFPGTMSESGAPDRAADLTPARPDQAWADTAVSRALFEQSPFSTVIYDAEGHLLAVNPAFQALWGVGIETAPPGYSILTDPELERQGALPLIRRAFAGKAVTLPPVRYDISAVATGGEGHA